jgi:hypothetical protein
MVKQHQFYHFPKSSRLIYHGKRKWTRHNQRELWAFTNAYAITHFSAHCQSIAYVNTIFSFTDAHANPDYFT